MTTNLETTVRTLEQRRFDVIVADDWDAFAPLCDAELRYVHSSGTIDTRESYLTKLREGFYDYHRIDSSIESMIVTPDLVLIRGTMYAELRAGDKEITVDNVIASAWVRRDDSWLLATHQSTGV
ncbi:DUF4440 domain-containing protein [Aeromicrobium sp. SMF47]|uniref:nuclear transport factor 2 family protein n=1 Tax=Aeromicrobium TaxID=2040 RepID=UPI00129D71E4|nr:MULTISPECIES: nuclear transport factor 2 family protein [Aeromicrobium]MRJ76139.1 DUF4440 domain-containing protein [Aeromicrobium yanjiei]MRK00489.1 DUF4440 domain-containing protein [Aeromicrobium sp. S22]